VKPTTGQAVVIHGDARRLPLADGSISSIVCDPPYEIGFMGRTWDSTGVAYDVATWREVYRVLKPGGHLVAFGGTRTYHRMACAIEDAGFEIRDSLHWIFGSGFPKSLDVSKALDKSAGAEREVIDEGPFAARRPRADHGSQGMTFADDSYVRPSGHAITAPATDAARQWAGFGTALKPAHEPIVLARKPLAGTVAQNVLTHGTGALNIDRTRIAPTGESRVRVGEESQERRYTEKGGTNFAATPGVRGGSPAGRWPTNLVLSHPSTEDGYDACADGCVPWCPVAEMDRQSASRFFPVFRYQAKAPTHERPKGDNGTGHPTVKPFDLLTWLVQLITPPGGIVLDPFAGTGTTLQAATALGLPSIGIELDAGNLPLITQRLRRRRVGRPARPRVKPITGQADLFAEAGEAS
jgi:site-specific DNA-methyltransferase (adenine-specific)